jgi:hypothetical protein
MEAGTEQKAPAAIRRASREQDAVRLLFLLDRASAAVGPDAPEGAVAVMSGQARLQALDFWMRNPDYLANELLTEFERSGDQELLEEAERILGSDEPDLRRFPMLRYFFGAFEPLDDALAVLRVAGLIAVRRVGEPGRVRRADYYLMAKGRETAQRLVAEIPAFSWYAERAGLVARVAGDEGGRALKTRQYVQSEYAGTALRDLIAPIAPRVRKRLEALR